MAATVYRDLFTDNANILSEFSAPADALDGAEVLFAAYHYEDYSGDATVIYTKDDKLFEVNGGHCSCYGLEGQWEPEETTWEAISMRSDPELKALAKERLSV